MKAPVELSQASTAIFGASDGLVASLAIVLVAYGEGRKVVLLALCGLLVAEALGMAASQYLAQPDVSLRQAGLMGAATGLAIIAVGAPWLVTKGTPGVIGSIIVAIGVATIISWLRPGRWETWVQTFGILVAVSTIAVTVGKLT